MMVFANARQARLNLICACGKPQFRCVRPLLVGRAVSHIVGDKTQAATGYTVTVVYTWASSAGQKLERIFEIKVHYTL